MLLVSLSEALFYRFSRGLINRTPRLSSIRHSFDDCRISSHLYSRPSLYRTFAPTQLLDKERCERSLGSYLHRSTCRREIHQYQLKSIGHDSLLTVSGLILLQLMIARISDGGNLEATHFLIKRKFSSLVMEESF